MYHTDSRNCRGKNVVKALALSFNGGGIYFHDIKQNQLSCHSDQTFCVYYMCLPLYGLFLFTDLMCSVLHLFKYSGSGVSNRPVMWGPHMSRCSVLVSLLCSWVTNKPDFTQCTGLCVYTVLGYVVRCVHMSVSHPSVLPVFSWPQRTPWCRSRRASSATWQPSRQMYSSGTVKQASDKKAFYSGWT